jgi:hypothetical protein
MDGDSRARVLVSSFPADGDLADIVQQTADAQGFDLLGGKPDASRDSRGIGGDPPAVPLGVGILGAHGQGDGRQVEEGLGGGLLELLNTGHGGRENEFVVQRYGIPTIHFRPDGAGITVELIEFDGPVYRGKGGGCQGKTGSTRLASAPAQAIDHPDEGQRIDVDRLTFTPNAGGARWRGPWPRQADSSSFSIRWPTLTSTRLRWE